MSVTTGSITISDRFGSLAISLSTTRARGKLCDIHGFLPTNTDTSACSNSPRVWPPYSCASTHASPVFSCANAFDRYFDPSAFRNAPLYAPPRWLLCPPPP